MSQQSGNTTAACAGTMYDACADEKALVAIGGRPIWRGAPPERGLAQILAEAIAAESWTATEKLLANLEGPFALAAVDFANQCVVLAIDRMGIERLTYSQSTNGLVFGSSCLDVARSLGVNLRIRQQAFFDFLLMHMLPSPMTVFENVLKLPPASMLVSRNGECRVQRYWRPEYHYASASQFPELKSGLKEALSRAVSDAGVGASTGAFLSGGLDSSVVSGMLAGQMSEPAKTFSIGFGGNEYDELEFARIASRHFGCDSFEYNVTPQDIVDCFPKIAAAYDEPFGNSSAVPTFFCAKLAAENGVDHLLAGDGGDELFAGNERYAKQGVFDLYRRIPGWLRRGAIEPMLAMVASDSSITPLRKAKSYVAQATIPLPDRFETWNLVYREGSENILDTEFAASIDLESPLRQMREVWSSAPSPDLLEKMLYYDWKFTLADNDLRKVQTMCKLGGVRVSFPMLHGDVVSLSTRVPPEMKMKPGELRSFFRRSMSDFLPAETLSKSKHGFGLPFGLWLKSDKALGELIYGLLSDLKKRRIISATFLTRLVDEHRAGHAAYYGYAIWDLAMLEAWLQHHQASDFTGRD